MAVSKFLRMPLKGRVNERGDPVALFFRGCWCQVDSCLDRWKDAGCWWEGESEKEFFRLQLQGDRVLEIYRDLDSGEWWSYKIYD